MNYQEIYERFIADRRSKEASIVGVFDYHHIVPRVLGGTDETSNLIRLTPEDHLFAHILLARIHGGMLVRAVYGMLLGKRYQGRAMRREYGWLRRRAAKINSEIVRAANARRGHGARLGILHTEASKAKMRENRRGIPRSADAAERAASKIRGRKQTEEHTAKRMAAKAKTLALKGRQASFGSRRSPEALAKMIATKKDKRMKLGPSYGVRPAVSYSLSL